MILYFLVQLEIWAIEYSNISEISMSLSALGDSDKFSPTIIVECKFMSRLMSLLTALCRIVQ